MKSLKGFNTDDDDIYDWTLLAWSLEDTAIFARDLSHIEYMEMKLARLKEVLSERNNNNDYSSDATARIRFTQKAISRTQKELSKLKGVSNVKS